jgi:Zn-dependent protease
MGTGWWVAETLHGSGAFALISWVFWVIFSITLHELGHGVAAIRAGDDTPVRTGHMTLNPVVHMGWTSLIVFAVVGIAWGAMPVSPWKFRGRHADAAVAFAGPAVNVGLWLLCVVAAAAALVWAPETAFGENIWMFFWTGAFLNAVLLVLNLLPIPPLDGSRIVASFVPSYRGLVEGPNAGMISLIGILFVFFVAGSYLFGTAAEVSGWAVGQVAAVLPG